MLFKHIPDRFTVVYGAVKRFPCTTIKVDYTKGCWFSTDVTSHFCFLVQKVHFALPRRTKPYVIMLSPKKNIATAPVGLTFLHDKIFITPTTISR